MHVGFNVQLASHLLWPYFLLLSWLFYLGCSKQRIILDMPQCMKYLNRIPYQSKCCMIGHLGISARIYQEARWNSSHIGYIGDMRQHMYIKMTRNWSSPHGRITRQDDTSQLSRCVVSGKWLNRTGRQEGGKHWCMRTIPLLPSSLIGSLIVHPYLLCTWPSHPSSI